MNRTPLGMTLMLAAALFLSPALPRGQQPSDEFLLRTAQELEIVKGDRKGAIAIYERLVMSADKTIAAEAIRALARLNAPPVSPRGQGASANAALDQFPSRVISSDPNIDGLGGARLSPDGRFAVGGPLGGSDWFIRDLETPAGRSLYACGGTCSGTSVFSPKGDRVAAVHQDMPGLSRLAQVRRGEASETELLMPTRLVVARVTTDLSTPLVVALPESVFNGLDYPAEPLAWSPNATRLAFVAAASQYQPTPSPDRNAPGGTYRVVVLDVDSGRTHDLPLTLTGVPVLTWLNDKEVAAHAARGASGSLDVHIVDATTGKGRIVTLPADDMWVTKLSRLSASSDVVVRQEKRGEGQRTLIVSSATWKAQPTCAGPAVAGGDSCLEFLPDGTAQLIWNQPAKRLRLRDVSTGVDRPLTVGSGEELSGKLSPDGSFVVFQSNRTGRWAIYAAPVAQTPTGNPIRISWLDDVLITLVRSSGRTTASSPTGRATRRTFSGSKSMRRDIRRHRWSA